MTEVLISGPYRLKAGSTRPLRGMLVDGRDKPLDLADADSLTFVMCLRDGSGTIVANGTCIILQGETDGEVTQQGWFQYNWSPGETDLPGAYSGEWVLNNGPGNVDRIPNDGYVEIEILGALS